MAHDLLAQLRSRRADYDVELTWVRYLIDAYTGGGGFAGKVALPIISSLGWVADAYGTNSGFDGFPPSDVTTPSRSYLDQYPREGDDKYLRRIELAHYDNYVQTILDLLLSYALKQSSAVENLPERLKTWRDSATLSGVSWDDLMQQVVARRAGLMGWLPMLIDQLPRAEGQSEAQVSDSGERLDPYVLALTPGNLLDFYTDPKTGTMVWAKFVFIEMRQPDPLVPGERVTVFKTFTATTIQTWELIGDSKKVARLPDAEHPFGEVPVVSFRQRPNVEDPIRGTSMVGDAAIAMRRLFNLGSELDEHIRSDVFALLQVPIPPGQESPKELLLGTGNAVPVPSDSVRDYKYVSPEASVASTIETRMTNIVEGVYRRARVQLGGDTRQQQSGIAKAWDFEETNRLLSDFTAQLARSERRVYVLVGTGMGIGSKDLDAIRVVPSTDFTVSDLMAELDAADKALSLELGAEADYRIKRRVIPRILPDLAQDDSKLIDDELLGKRDAELNEGAEDGEIQQAGNTGHEDNEEEGGSSHEEDE